VSKGFPNKDQIEELFIVMVSFFVFQHVKFSGFLLISIFKLQQSFEGMI